METLSIGGLPNYVLDLARALAESGAAVAVAHGSAELPGHLDLSGVTLLPLPLDRPRDASSAMRAWAPDVIHVHLCSHLPLLAQIEAVGVPLVRSFHDYTSMCLRRGRRRFPGDRCQRALSRSCVMFGCALGAAAPGSRLPGFKSIGAKLLERDAYRRFEAAVVGSRYMQATLISNGFAPDRVTLVPYFSRFDACAGGASAMDPRPPGVPGVDRPLSLLFSGQAVAGKGLKVLVRALAGLEGAWRLTTVSAGPDLAPAQALAQRLGMADRIEFKGWLPQTALAGLYRSADLLVIPSVWDDPGPLVGLEALSMETPVLGFPVGGIPDYAIEGRTGFLAESVSVASLRAGLRRAMAAGAGLGEMGRQGRLLVAEVHGRDRHVERIRAVYEAALRSRAVHAGQPARQPAAAWQ
ncbi:MAG TPA: glycosyltransferase family 4 protein [Albitalea sp.]|uniref:glycosyltransferase family 4 protein n=1 Tax=Piscinibacter sp. TaxID=1903157 RepID=UPI002ED185DF